MYRYHLRHSWQEFFYCLFLERVVLLYRTCLFELFTLEEEKHSRHEALVAAIAEKDAHIALLEQSHERPKDEIETLRQHKEKLMQKLNEENERRAQLLNSFNMKYGGSINYKLSAAVLSTIKSFI